MSKQLVNEDFGHICIRADDDINSLISKLETLAQLNKDGKYQAVRFDYLEHQEDGSTIFYFFGERLETDKELEIRMSRIKRNEEYARKHDHDYETYLALKQKYGFD